MKDFLGRPSDLARNAAGCLGRLFLCRGRQVDALSRLHGHLFVEPMRWCQRLSLLDHVGIGALIWEGKVQPFRKEASVKRHFSTVLLRNLLKPLHHDLGKLAWCVHRGGRNVAQQTQEMHRFGTGPLDLDLQVVQDTLALTQTTHRVIGRRGDAIGGALQVVGNAHLLLLIKSPNLLQVLHRFSELILRVVHPTIELSKGDTAITVSIKVH
mmetsp:Transcript_38159/g.82209  ORF Transcript_38159/g.82209 Transcript_38159/m.82209 type:complete len:211 (+) Transcript_38159:205-837(+)